MEEFVIQTWKDDLLIDIENFWLHFHALPTLVAGSRGLMVESQTHNRKVSVGGVNVQHSLHLQYHDEVPLSKTPNPQLLPGRHSINGCPLLLVCVHGVCVCSLLCMCTWMGKCRAWIPSMGHIPWLYVTFTSVNPKGCSSLDYPCIINCFG